MKKGDLVTWLYRDTKNPSHYLGILIEFEKKHGTPGAWVLWANNTDSPRTWSPVRQLAPFQ
jgi:hypothetical protein